MDGMNCVRIGTVVIMQRCQEGISQLRITISRNLYVLPTSNLKVDVPHINVGELSAELETVQDIARDNS